MSFSALSELAVSEVYAPSGQSQSLTVVLEGVAVAVSGAVTPLKPAPAVVPAGASGRAGKAKLGWAWVNGKIVYGTQEDIDRAIAALKQDAPKPVKIKTTPIARKLADLPQIELQIDVPYVDILAGTPSMEAHQAQLEVNALIRRMVAARLAEQDDEEAILLSL